MATMKTTAMDHNKGEHVCSCGHAKRYHESGQGDCRCGCGAYWFDAIADKDFRPQTHWILVGGSWI